MKLVGLGVGLAAVAGTVWVGYGTYQVSAAAEFDQSLGQVVNQVDRVGTSLNDAGTYVEREVIGVDVKAIGDIGLLIDEWKPRYADAITAYNRFSASIDSATTQAEAYFEAQAALTAQYNNPLRRAQAEDRDQEEYDRYLQWKSDAESKLELSLAILRRFEDMDTDLEKSRLASELTFEMAQFSNVPDEILGLSEQLEQFQIASRNVRDAIGGGF